jgi:hypothetical protein
LDLVLQPASSGRIGRGSVVAPSILHLREGPLALLPGLESGEVCDSGFAGFLEAIRRLGQEQKDFGVRDRSLSDEK